MSDAAIDVVVVTYRNATTIAAALSSVLGAPAVSHVAVVDNASSDGTVAAAEAAGCDDIVRNGENRGFAAAVNQGLARGAAEYVLLLNPDAALEGTSLDALLGALRADARAVFAGPLLVESDGSVCLGARRFSTAVNRLAPLLPVLRRQPRIGPEYTSLARRSPSELPTMPVDYLWGAALLCRREFLAAIGGLDERFFLYSEDEDLGRQARAAGRLSLLVPAARASHVGGHSSRGLVPLAAARLQHANLLLLRKWEGSLAAATFGVAALVACGLRAGVALLSSDRHELVETMATGRLLLALMRGADPATGR